MALKINKDKSKSKIKKTKKSKSSSKTKSKLLMSGKAAKDALEKERVLAKQRAAEKENSVFRFYLKAGQEETITFLDGDLDEDGDLENVCFYEHQLNSAGYPKYVCINDPSEGIECPVCASGSNPYFATVFTVLVHKEWSSKADPDNVHECSIQLFVAKSAVADKLRKKAAKYGGLKGVTFEVSRSNDKAFNVGDDFDFVQKDEIEDIIAAFPEEDKDGNSIVKPFDYEKVLPIYTEDELKEFGFGSASNAVGSEASAEEDDVL